MGSTKPIKVVLLTAFSIAVFAWAISAAFPTAVGVSIEDDPVAPAAPSAAATPTNPADYVGSETCQACHEDQFKHFKATKHAKLKEVASWKDKVQGCESCHGPGKAHLEDATDKTRIISFKGKNSKAISETCLACHSGKESHNEFRRGEHWRNDVGCTDCHSSHAPPFNPEKAGSGVYIANVARENPNKASTLRLKASEPQLCISCHQETRSQFVKPFHHKVLEGAMKCSDCHNPHGGFELKQGKISIGADAACIKCHSDKKGPFVFEHAPIKTEGCAACHQPHGSSNPKMLNRSSIRQMCIECHTKISDQEAPGLPSGHNQANVRYQNCNICHTQIHGSNTSNRFFR